MAEESLLRDLKLSLRIDSDDDDLILERNLLAAKAYVKGAIGIDDGKTEKFYERDDVKSLYEMAIIALASSYYTYRSSSMTGRVNDVNLSLNSIIGQLRGKYAQEELKGEADGSEH